MGYFEGYINHQVFEHNMDFIEDASITVFWDLPNPKIVDIFKKYVEKDQ